MPLRSLFALLAALVGAQAQEASRIFEHAVLHQGRVRRAQIADVYLSFEGQVVQDKEEHGVERGYWYRSKDRSFRVRTRSKARRSGESERGVDAQGYWERSGGRVVRLRRGNVDHREVIRRIDREREDFERILRMLLLSRLEGAEITLAEPRPVKLGRDLPWSARSILGNRDEHLYHVLDVVREKEPRLLLYVRTDDFTVRMAVQHDAGDKKKPRFWYYFGPFKRSDSALGMNLPVYFSAHEGRPLDSATRRSTSRAHGEIGVAINSGLKESDLRPG